MYIIRVTLVTEGMWTNTREKLGDTLGHWWCDRSAPTSSNSRIEWWSSAHWFTPSHLLNTLLSRRLLRYDGYCSLEHRILHPRWGLPDCFISSTVLFNRHHTAGHNIDISWIFRILSHNLFSPAHITFLGARNKFKLVYRNFNNAVCCCLCSTSVTYIHRYNSWPSGFSLSQQWLYSRC